MNVLDEGCILGNKLASKEMCQISTKKWFVLLTFLLILVADVMGFMIDSGAQLAHVHATIGLLAALAGLVSVVMVFRAK
jgi:hypothetical protein